MRLDNWKYIENDSVGVCSVVKFFKEKLINGWVFSKNFVSVIPITLKLTFKRDKRVCSSSKCFVKDDILI